MHLDQFTERYGGIYEHSPWVAEDVFNSLGVLDGAELVTAMANCVDQAPYEKKLALIRAHPDLAGRAAIAGKLTDESTEEQKSARLDQCTSEEFEQFQALNTAYWDKFGFPFVMAVRGSSRDAILTAFSARLENDADLEFETALAEIHKIARMRIEALC